MANKPTKTKAKRGPKAEVLKLDGDWRQNVKKAMQKPKPAGGWPKD
jgi:hypothetical protein